MRVMLDTNILVSMIFFPSIITRTFARSLSENHRIVLCDYVIEELRLVTERKFPNKMKDSSILATALLEDVDVFVTGDKDLHVLDVKRPEILTMTEFLQKNL